MLAQSKDTHKHYMQIDVLLFRRAIRRQLFVSDQDSMTWSWNYRREAKRTSSGYHQPTGSFLVPSTSNRNTHQLPVMTKLHTQIQDYTANIHSPRADCVVSVGVLMAYQQEQPSGFW